MEFFNKTLSLLVGFKPSLFITITFFIIGMIVPGAFGIALYDIQLFKELDLIKLILLSIGINSPILAVSFFLNIKIGYDETKDYHVENIFLTTGIQSIINSTIIFLIFKVTRFKLNTNIDNIYFISIITLFIYIIFFDFFNKKSK